MKPIISIFLLAATIFITDARNTSTAIFHPDIKSLRISDADNRLGQPILRGNNRISINFDELAEDNRFLRYRLVHCNSDWQPSSLTEMDYVNGFNEAQVTDYRLSENTLAHYVNYNITLPNGDMQPLVSGNYLVEIFDEDDPSTTLVQARFMVDEDITPIDMAVTSRTDFDYNGNHQQLSVKANLHGSKVENPYNDLKLIVVQNGRDYTRRELNHPLSVQSESAVYEHQKELIFPAGNEFRRFDIANTNYPGMGVESVRYTDPLYSAMLKIDEPRANQRYTYDQDQAGRFFPAEIYSDDADINADYVETFFTLSMPRMSEEVMLDGDLTIGADPTMIYDETMGAYIKTLLLKQGMYNYRYRTSSARNPIEGDHYETGNEYMALLYYCPPGASYERLIGSATIYSGK